MLAEYINDDNVEDDPVGLVHHVPDDVTVVDGLHQGLLGFAVVIPIDVLSEIGCVQFAIYSPVYQLFVWSFNVALYLNLGLLVFVGVHLNSSQSLFFALLVSKSFSVFGFTMFPGFNFIVLNFFIHRFKFLVYFGLIVFTKK